MDNLNEKEVEQILFDPENQPNQYGDLVWNGNELVFDGQPKCGVAGIASDMPEKFGEEIARRYNAFNKSSNTSFGIMVDPVIKWLNVNGHPHMTIIITPMGAELVEGVSAFNTEEHIRD